MHRFARDTLLLETSLELVPCSPPTLLFLERSPGAYSRTDTACRFLQLLRRTGTTSTTLVSSQGRRRRPSSFSDPPCLSLARAMTSGEPRDPSDLIDPGAGSFRLLGFTRPRYRPDHFPSLSAGDQMHGSVDRAKDVSSRTAGDLLGPRGECVCLVGFRLPHADDVPLLGSHGTPFVAGASEARRRRPPYDSLDRPRPPFHRLPAKGDDFPKTRCLSPSRPGLEKIAPLLLPSRPPAHAAHRPLSIAIGLMRALQALSTGFPGERFSGVRAPFESAGMCFTAPGTDDPSTPA